MIDPITIPIVAIVACASTAIFFPLVRAYARRLEQDTSNRPAPLPGDLTLRLERMEQAIDSIAIEVERISEGQRFVTRLLAERPGQASSGAASEPVANDGQLRALGAGPIQEIRTPQRQAVRTSITPH